MTSAPLSTPLLLVGLEKFLTHWELGYLEGSHLLGLCSFFSACCFDYSTHVLTSTALFLR